MDIVASEDGLVVDSRFSSRKKLVSDIGESGLVRQVVEAKSIEDGLQQLSSRRLDICFLGPSLRESAALTILQQGKLISRKETCAYIVVFGEEKRSPTLFKNAGAHAYLEFPYALPALRDVLKESVIAAKSGIIAEVPAGLRSFDLTSQRQRSSRMPLLFVEHLELLGDELNGIAKKIALGKLRLQADGRPSLATRDALWLSIESMLTAVVNNDELTAFDRGFVGALVQWFIDRCSMGHNSATEKLRRTLLSTHPDNYQN